MAICLGIKMGSILKQSPKSLYHLLSMRNCHEILGICVRLDQSTELGWIFPIERSHGIRVREHLMEKFIIDRNPFRIPIDGNVVQPLDQVDQLAGAVPVQP
ncbi:MAG: hypothetical protein JWO14_151 [Solirubrobacterales bacterium]|nr:hypothetical protein [Solirubrobacterales bacterium]